MALGASATLAFAPFNFWFVIFPIFVSIFVLLAKYSKHPFLDSWLFGFAYFGAGISWVHVSIATFGGVPLVVSLLMMAMLSGYLAIYFALAFWLLRRLLQTVLWPLAGPLIWLLCEYARATFLTGFPWLSIGYSQLDSPLSGLFPIIGEIGISAFMFGVCAAVATVFVAGAKSSKTAISYVVCTIVAIVLSTSVAWINPTGQSKMIALVQGNIEQSMRWRPELDLPTIEKYFALTEEHWDNDLIIWPEAAIPVLESLPLANETLFKLDTISQENNTALVTGVVDYNQKIDENKFTYEESFNFILALGVDQDSQNTAPYYYQHSNRYAKHKLVPIGEFVPFENFLRPLAPIFDLPMSSFNRGEYVQPNLIANGLYLVPALCYEVAFPNQIRANITPKSDMLLTVSNDAWFGDSHGPHQHLQIARTRAMEFGLPIIRATNTGITAAYDPNGNLLGELPQFVEGVLEVEVPLVSGVTPYKKMGNIPVFLIAAVMFAFAVYRNSTKL